MPRHPRLFVAGAIYHVYCRVARGEFVMLALLFYGFRGREVAGLLGKHGNSVTLWLSQGLLLERNEPEFKRRLNAIDAGISSAS